MATITFRLTGISPLLQNNPSAMRQQGQSGVARRTIPTPEEEAQRTAYKLPSGQYYATADAIRSSMLKAAIGLRYRPPTGGRAEAATSLVRAGIFILDEQCPLVDPENGSSIVDHEIDIRRVVLRQAGILRARAKLPRWQTTVTFEWDPQTIPENVVLEVLERAGKRIGIGDYRVEKGGPFGRFVVELLEAKRDA